MNQFDANKDYYGVLGVDKDAPQPDIDRQYKRQAAKHHPDRGGNEEKMKTLNEAYGVLKDARLRSEYDELRTIRTPGYPDFVPVTTPTARDVGVRIQWMIFLWPLAIVAALVVGFGVLLARSAMVAVNDSLPASNRFKRHTRVQEVAFWTVIVTGVYGLYLLLSYDY
jgi:curved DNA-binding protein CbpA